jgi:sialic acid synthase SpsE
MTEMTRYHNKVISVIRRAIEENMEERLLSEIGDNTVIREEDLLKEVRSLKPDLNFVTRSFGSSHTVLIDISCPYRRISYGANILEKVYIDKKEKYSKLAQERSNIQEMHVEIIPIIVSSLGAVHARSLEALRNLLLCDDKAMKKI